MYNMCTRRTISETFIKFVCRIKSEKGLVVIFVLGENGSSMYNFGMHILIRSLYARIKR